MHDLDRNPRRRRVHERRQPERTLEGKHVLVLGVSGSIASYKAAEVASRLVQEKSTLP
ncbi:MAG: hypothetical protein U0360_09345 [Dehalococcoidia bacterium]